MNPLVRCNSTSDHVQWYNVYENITEIKQFDFIVILSIYCRERLMDSRELRQSRPAYSETFNNDSSLRMDRASHTHSNNVPRFQEV